ncbi:unnamed protein product, partial [Amoebophrya sp. A25]
RLWRTTNKHLQNEQDLEQLLGGSIFLEVTLRMKKMNGGPGNGENVLKEVVLINDEKDLEQRNH